MKKFPYYEWFCTREILDISREIFHLNSAGEQVLTMSKTVNNVQLDMLVTYMQQNPAIAQNFSKQNKEKVEAFWKKAEKDLNSAGPPQKSIAEWKKVWMDQKRYVRKKASQNYVRQHATGGGPNEEMKLLSVEESIFQLMGTKDSVEGSGQCFGLPKPTVSHVNAETFSIDDGEDNSEVECISDQVAISFEPNKTKSNNTKVPKQANLSDMIQKEIEMQKELCEKGGNAIEVSKEHNTETQGGLKQIYRALDRLCEFEEQQLEEMKRHHCELETLRKAEVESQLERNRLAMQLDELKLVLEEQEPKD